MTEPPDRATIADLEAYGLPVKLINALEDHFGAIYVDQLAGVTDKTLLGVRIFGKRSVALLREAIQRQAEGAPLKTPEECVVFHRP